MASHWQSLQIPQSKIGLHSGHPNVSPADIPCAPEEEASTEQGDKGSHPSGMRRPGRGGDQVAIDMDRIHSRGRRNILATRQIDLEPARGIGAASPAFQDASSRQDLRAMTNGSNRFVALHEVTHQSEHAVVQPQVLRGTTARNNQGIEVGRLDRGEISI